MVLILVPTGSVEAILTLNWVVRENDESGLEQ